jgi:hypothetical protein
VGRHLSPASSRWFNWLPPVTATIDCNGAPHRITWRGGRLILEDHDPLAERSLAALGGNPPMCLELFDAWSARRGSERVSQLLLGDKMLTRDELRHRKVRHDAEVESAKRMPQVARMNHGGKPDGKARIRIVEQQAAERLEREQQDWANTLIEMLPPRLRRALALSVIVNIERGWEQDGFRQDQAREIEPALAKLAAPLFEESAHEWGQDLKPYTGFKAKAEVARPFDRPSCTLWADHSVVHADLSLPLSWFVDVWARGLALVSGCFVLGVTDSSSDGSHLQVMAVRLPWENWKDARSLERTAIVSRGGPGGWHLRWA